MKAKPPLSHTPGPWEVTVSGEDVEVMQEDGQSVAVILTEPEMMANAHLIAAAPELLEASRKALGYLTDLGIDLDGEDEEIVAGLRLSLHDAIAKTEGKETPNERDQT